VGVGGFALAKDAWNEDESRRGPTMFLGKKPKVDLERGGDAFGWTRLRHGLSVGSGQRMSR